MAEKINIVQVPEVETISKLLGVDANNTWAKIPATKFASTETVESVNATANEAVTTANAAKVNADRLFGMARSVYVVPLNETQDYSVSALWFCNGLTDPTASLPPASEPGAYGTIACFPSGNAEVKLRLVSLSAIPEKTTAEFSCLSNAAKLTLYAGNTELGYFIRGDGESGFSYSARIVDGSIIIISAMAGCTFTPTYTGSSYWVLVASGGGDSINVDSSLNLESTNPVQNKVVTSALNAKAPLASPTFTGTPKSTTPTSTDNSTRIATTAYVKTNLADKADINSPAFTGSPTAPKQVLETLYANTDAIVNVSYLFSAKMAGNIYKKEDTSRIKHVTYNNEQHWASGAILGELNSNNPLEFHMSGMFDVNIPSNYEYALAFNFYCIVKKLVGNTLAVRTFNQKRNYSRIAVITGLQNGVDYMLNMHMAITNTGVDTRATINPLAIS